MAPLPNWYTSADVLIAAPITLTGVPGSPGSAVTVRLRNNFNGVGADPIINARIKVVIATVTGGEEFIADGTEFADRRYVEMKQVSGLDGLSVAAGDWHPMGAGAYLLVPEIGNDQGIEYDIRLSGPADALADDVDIALRLEIELATATPEGLSECAVDGIYLGIGDTNQTLLIAAGNVTQDTGSNDNVLVPQIVGLAAGIPYVVRAFTQQLLAAAAGKARYDLISINASGVKTVTAGSELTPPLTDANKPAVPSGHKGIAYVYRDDTGAIQTADVTNLWQLGLYSFSSASLVGTISPGPHAVLDNSLTYNLAAQNVNLTDAATNYIYLLRDGTLEVNTTGVKPAARALLLWEAVTAGGAVTVTRDRRFLTGFRSHQVQVDWQGEIAIDQWRYGIVHNPRTAYLHPLVPMIFSLGSQGSGTGAQTRAEVEVERSAAWVSLFATATNRPTIAWDAVAPLVDEDSVPDRFDLPPKARIRAKISEIPTGSGGVEPNDAVLSLEVIG